MTSCRHAAAPLILAFALFLGAAQPASATLTSGFYGTSTDDYENAPCPSQSVLTGLQTYDDNYVEGLAPLCTPIPLPGTASVAPVGVFFGGGTFHSSNCPSTKAMVGANGRIGSWLDQIQVVCRTVDTDGTSTGTTESLTASGGNGGGPASTLCAEPEAGTGIRIYLDNADQFISGIAINCETLVYPDTEPPETTITSGPRHRTHRRKATFDFTSSEPNSTFECKLDDRPFRSCTPPKTYDNLAFGPHRLAVRATDEAENTDPKPDGRRWRIAR